MSWKNSGECACDWFCGSVGGTLIPRFHFTLTTAQTRAPRCQRHIGTLAASLFKKIFYFYFLNSLWSQCCTASISWYCAMRTHDANYWGCAHIPNDHGIHMHTHYKDYESAFTKSDLFLRFAVWFISCYLPCNIQITLTAFTFHFFFLVQAVCLFHCLTKRSGADCHWRPIPLRVKCSLDTRTETCWASLHPSIHPVSLCAAEHRHWSKTLSLYFNKQFSGKSRISYNVMLF